MSDSPQPTGPGGPPVGVFGFVPHDGDVIGGSPQPPDFGSSPHMPLPVSWGGSLQLPFLLKMNTFTLSIKQKSNKKSLLGFMSIARYSHIKTFRWYSLTHVPTFADLVLCLQELVVLACVPVVAQVYLVYPSCLE